MVENSSLYPYISLMDINRSSDRLDAYRNVQCGIFLWQKPVKDTT